MQRSRTPCRVDNWAGRFEKPGGIRRTNSNTRLESKRRESFLEETRQNRVYTRRRVPDLVRRGGCPGASSLEGMALR
jgi:hypothetical protein